LIWSWRVTFKWRKKSKLGEIFLKINFDKRISLSPSQIEYIWDVQTRVPALNYTRQTLFYLLLPDGDGEPVSPLGIKIPTDPRGRIRGPAPFVRPITWVSCLSEQRLCKTQDSAVREAGKKCGFSPIGVYEAERTIPKGGRRFLPRIEKEASAVCRWKPWNEHLSRYFVIGSNILGNTVMISDLK